MRFEENNIDLEELKRFREWEKEQKQIDKEAIDRKGNFEEMEDSRVHLLDEEDQKVEVASGTDDVRMAEVSSQIEENVHLTEAPREDIPAYLDSTVNDDVYSIESVAGDRDSFAYRRTADNKERGKRGFFGYFMSGFSGILIGALLVYFLLANFTDIGRSSGGINNTNRNNLTSNMSLDLSTSITEAAAEVAEAVVGISNIQNAQTFFGESAQQEVGTGSGVIYKIDDGKAYVITNHHVIEGSTSLEVTLSDGKKVPAEIIGGDALMDLAVVSIPSEGIETVAEFGDSDSLKPGENVIAIGNPLGLEFSGSVTAGVISGLNRAIPIHDNYNNVIWNAEVLQTDAAINSGNSGGALVNMKGQVIGINSMKISQATVEGMGFSIPINSAIPVINDLEEHGVVKRPLLGVDNLISVDELTSFQQKEMLKLPEGTEGVVAQQITKGSPADDAGLQDNDVIIEVGGKETKNLIELRQVLFSNKVGDTVEVKFYRNGELKTVKAKLGEAE